VTLGSPAILIDLEDLNGMWSMCYCGPEKGLILETVARERGLKGRTSGRTTGGYTATGAGEDLFPDLGRVCVLSSTTIAHCLRQANGYALETHRYLLYGLCASITWTQVDYVPHGWSRNDHRCAPLVDTSEYWGGDTYLEHLTEPIEASV